MKTTLKVLIILAFLGFIGNLLNEKLNISLIVFIVILGIILILLEHYKPLDMKKKHKESIIFVVYNLVSKDLTPKETFKLIEQLMKIMDYRNSIGFTVSDTCNMLIEDANNLLKQFSEFDDYQIQYFEDKLKEIMRFKEFPEHVTISKVNHYLKSISAIQID